MNAKTAATKGKPSVMNLLATMKPTGITESEIALNLIDPDPEQPRRTWHSQDGVVPMEEEVKLRNLAASIKEQGLIQAITVREVDGRYMIIVGERRWRAHGLLKLSVIRCVVRNDLTTESIRLFQLYENMQSSKMSDYDTAMFVKGLMAQFPNLQKKDLAEMLDKQPSYVTRIMALIDSRWADVVNSGVIRYASVLEQFRALPPHKRDELKAKAKASGKPISAQDTAQARKEHRAAAGAGAGWPSGQEKLSPDVVRDAVAASLAEQQMPGETYARKPDPALPINDHGAEQAANLPGSGREVYHPAAIKEHRVEMTVGQLSRLADVVEIDGSESVSIKLDVDLMQQAILKLGGKAPIEVERTSAVLLDLLLRHQ